MGLHVPACVYGVDRTAEVVDKTVPAWVCKCGKVKFSPCEGP